MFRSSSMNRKCLSRGVRLEVYALGTIVPLFAVRLAATRNCVRLLAISSRVLYVCLSVEVWLVGVVPLACTCSTGHVTRYDTPQSLYLPPGELRPG